MQCDVARKHLYLQQRPPKDEAEGVVFPISAEATQAREHLTHCAACQEFFAAEERLTALLRARAPRERASGALREQMLKRIGQERARLARRASWHGLKRNRGLAFALTGLLIILALSFGLWSSGREAHPVPEPIAAILIDDHIHNLPAVTEITSSDQNAVRSWFQGKVDFSFHLPTLQEPALLGGRRCSLLGQRAALIYYQHPQSIVSLFIFDGSDLVLPEDRTLALDGRRCLVDARKGYNVVLWKDRGLLYGLVSDLRSVDLIQLAERF
jgi:anti-sigma factor RsiW